MRRGSPRWVSRRMTENGDAEQIDRHTDAEEQHAEESQGGGRCKAFDDCIPEDRMKTAKVLGTRSMAGGRASTGMVQSAHFESEQDSGLHPRCLRRASIPPVAGLMPFGGRWRSRPFHTQYGW